MTLSDFTIDKEYITAWGVKAFFRGVNVCGAIFEISTNQLATGIKLIIEKPETDIASGYYWNCEGLESDFLELNN